MLEPGSTYRNRGATVHRGGTSAAVDRYWICVLSFFHVRHFVRHPTMFSQPELMLTPSVSVCHGLISSIAPARCCGSTRKFEMCLHLNAIVSLHVVRNHCSPSRGWKRYKPYRELEKLRHIGKVHRELLHVGWVDFSSVGWPSSMRSIETSSWPNRLSLRPSRHCHDLCLHGNPSSQDTPLVIDV